MLSNGVNEHRICRNLLAHKSRESKYVIFHSTKIKVNDRNETSISEKIPTNVISCTLMLRISNEERKKKQNGTNHNRAYNLILERIKAVSCTMMKLLATF